MGMIIGATPEEQKMLDEKASAYKQGEISTADRLMKQPEEIAKTSASIVKGGATTEGCSKLGTQIAGAAADLSFLNEAAEWLRNSYSIRAPQYDQRKQGIEVVGSILTDIAKPAVQACESSFPDTKLPTLGTKMPSPGS
jgi:hypothetical protein